MMKRAIAILLVLISALTFAQVRDNPSRVYQLRDLGRVNLKVGSRTIPAWVMDINAKRQEGMMFLTKAEVKDGEGMIFVFPDERPRSFWMSNTVLALDIIYIRANGVVDSIRVGKPFDETSLPSKGPAMYVLELKKGMSARFGIRPGTRVTIPKSVRSKD